jgi:hypothetical protein
MSEDDQDVRARIPGAARQRPGWQRSFAHWLGNAARWATAEVDSVAEWTKEAVVGPPRRVQRPSSGPRPDPLGPLIERLARLFAESGSDGYRALARDPTFWSLVDRLHARRPRRVGARTPPRPAQVVATKPPANDQAHPADAAEPRSEPEIVAAIVRDEPDETRSFDGETREPPIAVESIPQEPVTEELRSPGDTPEPPAAEPEAAAGPLPGPVREVDSGTEEPAPRIEAPATESAAPEISSAANQDEQEPGSVAKSTGQGADG